MVQAERVDQLVPCLQSACVLKVAVCSLIFALFFASAACVSNRMQAGSQIEGETFGWEPRFKIHRDVFKNGLTVLFVEDHAAPVVSYSTWFKVGSAWEKPGATGIAHLFEHMMFKGTPRYNGKQFFKILEGKGALINAFTQRDATVYYEVIASKDLELVIDMESDRLAHLTFAQTDLDAERQVVKEERRLRVESHFPSQQLEELRKIAFPGHPYGWPIVGYQEDLDHLTLEECRSFFKNYYQPGNAIITIAGDFDYEVAKEWIKKYYGPIEGHAVPDLKLRPPHLWGHEVRQEIKRPVKAESLLIGYYIPSLYSEDAEKLSMLSWALFGMSSSRANLKLVRQKQIALGVAAEAELERYPNLFFINVEMKNGIPASLALQEIDRLVSEVQSQPLSAQELSRVKNGLIYAAINEARSPAGVANWMAGGEFYFNDYRHPFEKLKKLHAMKPEDLLQAARQYLRPENRVVVVMKPERG